MPEPLPSFFQRLAIALASFFRALGDAHYAALLAQLRSTGALPAAAPAPGLLVSSSSAAVPALAAPAPGLAPPAPPAPGKSAPAPAAPTPTASAHEGALHLLALLQREGRLLDFCEEELASFSDAAVGAAARLVHSGCRKALRENLELAPIRTEAEGARVVLESGFDARAIRLTGNVVGDPPFTGALKHHGWRAAQVRLPEPPRGEAARLLAPAEVELP